MSKFRILFLCTGNSIRSQMAEAWFREMGGEPFEVFSAGVSPSGIHPMTHQVMREAGIDLSEHRSKSVDEVPVDQLDYVITLCGYARDICPTLPEKLPTEHWPIEDPVQAVGSGEERLGRFREIRDEIRQRVEKAIKRLTPS